MTDESPRPDSTSPGLRLPAPGEDVSCKSGTVVRLLLIYTVPGHSLRSALLCEARTLSAALRLGARQKTAVRRVQALRMVGVQMS